MSSTLDASAYHNLLRSFLAEDTGAGDITTETIVPPTQLAHGELIAKAPLVLAGIDLFVEIFRILDSSAAAEIDFHDGDELAPGQIPVRVTATARALLTGERVALNLLQRLSGVATLTRQFVRAVAGTDAQIVDTRKTTPGFRSLEKVRRQAETMEVAPTLRRRRDLLETTLHRAGNPRARASVLSPRNCT